MNTSAYTPDDSRIKHLELLQATVNRLGTNSFIIKGWAMTVSGGLVAAAMAGGGWAIALIALMMAAGFWLLDSYYLEQERLFRSLYERSASTGTDRIPLFSMDVARYAQSEPWHLVALSNTMVLFYGTVAVVDIALTVVLMINHTTAP
ncbi:hypothetical protein ACIQCD_18560 [Streptomyces sp. NPDC093250]|uniref:hypothetical protein n=1 Tax=Streptomyces sp. NPDC093250 TaxID=3366036 RepID=UPI003819D36D